MTDTPISDHDQIAVSIMQFQLTGRLSWTSLVWADGRARTIKEAYFYRTERIMQTYGLPFDAAFLLMQDLYEQEPEPDDD